jgi:Uma2 family endonuclease
MATQPSSLLTPEQYLDLERVAEEKHEFIDGAMVAMAGGFLRHALISANAVVSLNQALRGKRCLTFSSDARVSVFWDRLITYPDVSVVCGKPEFVDGRKDTLTNPTMIVEVLSPSTRNFDQGEKARRYRQLPSLREFLIVEQERVFVEQYRRLPDGSWQILAHDSLDAVIGLQSHEATIAVAELYAGVDAL